jgi:hypothetical protein
MPAIWEIAGVGAILALRAASLPPISQYFLLNGRICEQILSIFWLEGRDVRIILQ